MGLFSLTANLRFDASSRAGLTRPTCSPSMVSIMLQWGRRSARRCTRTKRSLAAIKRSWTQVAIDSTKSSRKENQRRNPGDSATRSTESSVVPDGGLSERNWRIAAVAILAVGGFLRLYELRLGSLQH